MATLNKKTKKLLATSSVVTVKDPDARDFLSRLGRDEAELADTLWESLTANTGVPSLGHLTDYDLDQLSWSIFDFLGDGEEPVSLSMPVIRRFFDVSAIVMGLHMPAEFKQYVEEARLCYAFEQYNAVVALCRTSLETAMAHFCLQKGLLQAGPKLADIRLRNAAKLRELVSQGQPRLLYRLDTVYDKASRHIHGRSAADRTEAREILSETFGLIHEICS